MEGLHHDTDLESTQMPGEKDLASNEEKMAENLSPDSDLPVVSSDYSSDPINTALTSEQRSNFMNKWFGSGDLKKDHFVPITGTYWRVSSFVHWAEAVAVGSVSVLGKDDHIITAYRDHGHALAVGMNMDECMAELYGKKLVAPKVKVDPCTFSPLTRIFGAAMELLGGRLHLV